MEKNPYVADPTLNRLNNLSRWQGFPTQQKESVSQHSYWVTYWTTILMEELLVDCVKHKQAAFLKLEAIQLAVFHDLDEAITGDVAHPVKYNNVNGEALRKCLKEYAESAVRSKWDGDVAYDRLIMKAVLGDHSYTAQREMLMRIVKVADYLSMFNYAKHELELGNTNMCSEMLFGIQNLIIDAIHHARQAIGTTGMQDLRGWNLTCFKAILAQVHETTSKLS
jgi:5'-deoxynucleotidase YfbR-like HD superfamily hydrolase